MGQWKACVMQIGGGTIERSVLVRYRGGSEQIHVPYVSVAATDGKHKVILDTGPLEVDTIVKPHAHRTPDEELPAVLKRCMGWDVSEVDTVINTHLHYDHCGGNVLFPNATFYVQRAEWEAAHNLSPTDYYYYLPSDYAKEQINNFRWKFLDGDTDLFDGFRMLFAPGHTRGTQVALMDTTEGALCFASDAIPTQMNLNEYLEPNIVVDEAAALRSMALIRRCANRVIFGHEDALSTGMKAGFPLVPPAVQHRCQV